MYGVLRKKERITRTLNTAMDVRSQVEEGPQQGIGESGDRCEAVLNLGYADDSVNVLNENSSKKGRFCCM